MDEVVVVCIMPVSRTGPGRYIAPAGNKHVGCM